MNIISIGDLVTDFYYKDGKLIGLNGGMTSHNIVSNLSVLGYKTKVIGVCGKDDAGNLALQSLKDLGVDITNVVKKDIHTRCFHISYVEKEGKLAFTSKKRCPLCQQKRWYDKSELNIENLVQLINKEDIVIIDNVNEINMAIINQLSNDIMLDLGQYFELENKTDLEMKELLANKFSIIQMNERVEKYLINRFNFENLQKLYDFISPTLLVVTRGEKGADFVYANKLICKKTEKVVEEIDATGAGDAFFSCVIDEFIKDQKKISETFIDSAYKKATKLTSKVLKKMGARGHLHTLYKIKSSEKICSCENFTIIPKRTRKRINININSLEKRVLNALTSKDAEALSHIIDHTSASTLFIGAGGSFAAAYFASRVVNELKGITTLANYPREILFRNNNDIDKIFLFSYSGSTADLFYSIKYIDKQDVFVITKGKKLDTAKKTGLDKDHILTYYNGLYKGRERGFLSFEGVVAPSALFLSILLKIDTKNFIVQCFTYWNEFFQLYFKENKKHLKNMLKKDNMLNLFKGDYTNTCALDLESKIIESGIYHLTIHEKKNFSHGRFIHLEHQKNDCNIYLKQKSTSEYEKNLLQYLSTEKTIIIESQYDGLKAEFDLLIASQFFIYYISNLLNIDLSKPVYSDESLNLYFYKGEL